MPILEGPDCRLWFEQVGSGDPLTLFVHGVTGSLDELVPLASRTPGTRVLLDLRGHGRSESPPPEAGYDHPAMRRDVEAAADAVGATRAFGASMGGGAIMNLLADRPDRFERVCLFLPASVDGPNEGAVALFPPLAHDIETKPLEQVAEEIATQDNPIYDARPYWRELARKRTLLINAGGAPNALRGYAFGAPPVTDPALLERVTCPVLLLGQEGDAIHDAAHARRLAGIFPNAELRVWDEPLAMYDDLDGFAELIGSFLAG